MPCEDANSKLVEVVSVADVDDEKRSRQLYKFCSDFELKDWSRV